MSEITLQRALEVMRDFESFGGASVELVAWELSAEVTEVAAAWERARAAGLITRAPAQEPAPGAVPTGLEAEDMFVLTTAGWELLGIDPEADRRRGETIARLGVLERISDPSLSALTRITSFVMDAESAAVHVFDERYQYRIAAVNAPLGHHPAHDTMCRLVIDSGTAIIAGDAVSDGRFAHSTFVGGTSPVRFYASSPLRVSDGTIVGTLCAFDHQARQVSETQRGLLEDLALQAISQIEFTRVAVDLDGLLPRADPARRDDPPATG